MNQELSLVVAATFTAEPLKDSLGFWMRELGIPVRIDFAPYNQVFQQLLDPSSIIATNQNGINIVLIRLEDWQGGDSDTKTTGRDDAYHAIERNLRDFKLALSEAVRRAPTPYLVCLCPASPAWADDPKRALAFKQAEALLCAQLAEIDSVWMITPSELAAAYPVPDYYDAYGEKFGHIPLTPVYFTALGTMIAREVYALKSPPYKVIVLDCDQTLWSGVCGEDGPSGIRIDVPHRVLQDFMVRQHDAGMLLCLCSKNNEEDVTRVFENRPEMPLNRNHIVSRRVNWKPKSANLVSLAEELQLGLDSFIFIDDDPVECAEVRANCPEVLTLEIPRQVEAIPRFLDHVWAFDHLKITDEGKKRTALYQQNAQREQLRGKSFTVSDFLAKLGLEIEISPLMPHQLARASELTQRTNQFNLTTVRRSEAELRRVQQRERMEPLAVHVKDRFGDYGLVGLIVFHADSEAISVDTFLLSCRALGRGVEHRMLVRLGEIALDRELKRVDARLIQSGKNQPAVDFMDNAGAKFRDSGEEGLLFRFPAKWAAALTFRPDDRGPQSENEGEQRTGSSATPRAYPIEAVERCRLLLRIATELSDVDQIHASMLSQDRHSRPNLETHFVAPRDSTEAAVGNIWCEVLNVDRVGACDNFFELGGDSLTMTRVVSRIRQSFGVELSPGVFFNAPTVAEIAQVISADSNSLGNAAFIEQLLGELSQISEDDARALLEEERFGTGEVAPPFRDTVTGSRSKVTGLDDALVPRQVHAPGFGRLPSVGTTQAPVGPGIASVSIMTHNRLKALERALISYIENSRAHGRNHEFVVIDGTETEEAQSRSLVMLSDLERRYGVRILYAGRRDKIRFAKELVSVGGLPPDIVNFALFDVECCGNDYGVSRNALLLDSIGQAVFSADDDTVCRIATAPNPATGTRFATEWDPADIWFFPDRDSALRSVTFVDEDILSAHEQLLGGDVPSLLGGRGDGDKPGPADLDPSCENRSERTGGRVLATFNGLVGDCAWGSPFGDWGGPMGCLLLNDESHRRLVRSEADYRTACTTREILRVVDRPTINGETLCMTVFMALDNRELLPPFFPVKAGEDIVFGLTLRRCIAGGYFGQLPRALVHAPVEHRTFSRGEIFRSASGFDTAKLMIGCVKSYGENLARTDVKEGLRALGSHLEELASMPARGFQEIVRDQVWKSTNSFIAMMANRLQASDGLPRFWANDVERYMDQLGKGIRRPDYCVPLDLLNGRSDDEARELAQRLVLKFGQLLRWWPDIAETARELRARGQRLAKQVGLE